MEKLDRYIKYNDSVPTIIDTKGNKLISGIDEILDLVNYLELRNEIMNTNVLKENNNYYKKDRDEWRTKCHILEYELKRIKEIVSGDGKTDKFRLRFADGDNGEVVNQNGVQLYPREIVNVLNRQQYIMDKKDKIILSLKEQIKSMKIHHIDKIMEECEDEIR